MENQKVKRCSVGQSLDSERQYYDDIHAEMLKNRHAKRFKTFSRDNPDMNKAMDNYFQAVFKLYEHDQNCDKCKEAEKQSN